MVEERECKAEGRGREVERGGRRGREEGEL